MMDSVASSISASTTIDAEDSCLLALPKNLASLVEALVKDHNKLKARQEKISAWKLHRQTIIEEDSNKINKNINNIFSSKAAPDLCSNSSQILPPSTSDELLASSSSTNGAKRICVSNKEDFDAIDKTEINLEDKDSGEKDEDEYDSLDKFMVNVTSAVAKINAEDERKLNETKNTFSLQSSFVNNYLLPDKHDSTTNIAGESQSTTSSILDNNNYSSSEAGNKIKDFVAGGKKNIKITSNDETGNFNSLETTNAQILDENARFLKGTGKNVKEEKSTDYTTKAFDEMERNTNDFEGEEEEEDILEMAARRLSKRKEIIAVDHSAIDYKPFRKDFWIEPPELARLTNDEVRVIRSELDGIRIVGRDCPKPIKRWTQCGLPASVLETLKKHGMITPTPVQAQAIPAVMSGRDVIAVARTGSGKTLAFLLPLLRHVKDQGSLLAGDGPIALILTPTRELALQIHREARMFSRPLGLRPVVCYGGPPVSEQIAELKRGAEIVVATPGRLIDLLCANSGRVTNLRRVTFLVLDEADRMFDMGFEPQVTRLLSCIRPTRQTVLFSATFPRAMEALARRVLQKPLEIAVGSRTGAVAEAVTQFVEIVPEAHKFLRLLDILGRWFAKSNANAKTEEVSAAQAWLNSEPRVLIFVERQDAADHLMASLLKHSYVCNSLHGGKDQMDRDSTVADFKCGVFPILIATSVASRGLDVKGLTLVINFDCPNHREDYVHRVGRTGRAGNTGTAYTFISPDQERFAPDIVEALKTSKADIPDELTTMALAFREKVKGGHAQGVSKGFGGKGLEKLDKERDNIKKVQKINRGVEDDEDEEEEEEVNILPVTQQQRPESSVYDPDAMTDLEENNNLILGDIVLPPTVAVTIDPEESLKAKGGRDTRVSQGLGRAQYIINRIKQGLPNTSTIGRTLIGNSVTQAQVGEDSEMLINALQPNNQIAGVNNQQQLLAVATEGVANYTCEFEINDYPQRARWKVTNKEQINIICEFSGAAITTRGTFFQAGKLPKELERKLYLYIEGETQIAVDKAKHEIARLLREAVLVNVEMELKSGPNNGGTVGRYSVV